MSKVLFAISPTLNSFVDKKKGTSGNRIDCAAHHAANGIRSDVEIAAVATAATLIGKAGVTNAIKKASIAAQAAGATTASIPLADLFAAKGNLKKKAVEIYKHMPTWAKAGAAALLGLSLIVRSYKTGKIEQKYEDRAQFVDRTFVEDKKQASAPIKKDTK